MCIRSLRSGKCVSGKCTRRVFESARRSLRPSGTHLFCRCALRHARARRAVHHCANQPLHGGADASGVEPFGASLGLSEAALAACGALGAASCAPPGDALAAPFTELVALGAEPSADGAADALALAGVPGFRTGPLPWRTFGARSLFASGADGASDVVTVKDGALADLASRADSTVDTPAAPPGLPSRVAKNASPPIATAPRRSAAIASGARDASTLRGGVRPARSGASTAGAPVDPAALRAAYAPDPDAETGTSAVGAPGCADAPLESAGGAVDGTTAAARTAVDVGPGGCDPPIAERTAARISRAVWKRASRSFASERRHTASSAG